VLTRHQNIHLAYDKTYTIFGNTPGNTQRAIQVLARQGFSYDATAPAAILFDAPLGFGLHTLQTMLKSPEWLIIVTQSRCPEYWDDLWDFRPTSVLLESELEWELECGFAPMQRTKHYRSIPAATTRLTPTERNVLRLLACGNSNPRIAETIGVQHKTIRNVLTTIYEKLGVENRTDAILYYWDTWHGCAKIAR
jgi:DNA-binding CsgD family transcriptional regulator